MLALLLLQAATPQTAVDAERAFAAAAQARGQWTAFREFMTDDAIMFTPQAVKAKEWVPEKDPPVAVQWWPAESYVSCDGTAAVNTGPWVLPKTSGYFTTVWRRQVDGGWKWSLDHGDALAKPRKLPARPHVRRASCKNLPRPVATDYIVTPEIKIGRGASRDDSLSWMWKTLGDGSRSLSVRLWNGEKFVEVIHDVVAAPPK